MSPTGLTMDVPRERPRRPTRRWLVPGTVGVAALALVTVGLSRLGSAAPAVRRDALWIDTVKRGELVREVRGPGTLVPEQIRFVSASWAARVEAIHVKAGETVEADTVLLTLGNPELELQALDAERQLASAQAALVELATQGSSTQLQLDAALATLKYDADEAARVASANEKLTARGMVSAQESARSTGKSSELEQRVKLEQGRQGLLKRGLEQRLAAEREQLARLRAVARFRRRQVDALEVRAGEPGVVQELVLQPGQWVGAGTLLAKVAQPQRLKAEVRISEAQARDIAVGQPARIDTRQGLVPGTVTRIDPSVVSGTVKVDVSLTGELPKGARPDLTIDGIVELERLEDVLFVGRPAFVSGESASLFRVDGSEASRTKVVFGKSSVSAIEVKQGLHEGDAVILSDMSQHETHERLELK